MVDLNSSILEKHPPQNLEAEKAVIASMLIDSNAVSRVADQLIVDDFSQDVHKIIIQTILELYNKSEPIDLVTINNALKSHPFLKQLGGASYLAEVIDTVPTSANVEYYLKIIREKAELRKLISICTDIIQRGYTSKEEVPDLIDNAESRIFEIAQKRISVDFIEIKPALKETLDYIEQLYHKKDQYTGVPTGFYDLDELTAGFQPSDLIVIAARPSMGKTAFCLNLAENIGIKYQKGIAFFSLEMSKQQLCQRLISSHSRIDGQKIRTGKIAPGDFPRLSSTVAQLSKAKIFLDDSPSISTLEIRAKARRLMTREEVHLIIIDYLQLIAVAGHKRSENRQNEIAEISRTLKTLARELGIPIIAISQLSRGVESRGGDHRPKLSDLRDSGAIEQDADVVGFIYRDEYYFQDDESNKGKAELIIAKQRNGPTGTVQLAFNSANARFDNFSRET